jgi:peptide/nickel transport system ATP-binding protein
MRPDAVTAPVLELRQLNVAYSVGTRVLPVVQDFNLTLRSGDSHGLVGESGCGKSTVALAILQWLGRHGRITSGEVLYKGRDLCTLSGEALRKIRGAEIAMVYQEPMASLNPTMRIGEQLAEVPRYHAGVSHREAHERARSMLNRVRLSDDRRIMQAYPHELSGGQQQRVGIAMALLSNPSLLLLDEPTTALDVTVEADIVDLIGHLSAELGMSMLYISHNLALLRTICERITVMYAGEVVEAAPTQTLFEDPRHPYTRQLLAAMPSVTAHKNQRSLQGIAGQPPAPDACPSGCAFGPRCGYFLAGRCDAAPVPLTGATAFHEMRCLRSDEIEWAVPSGEATVARDTVSSSTALRVRALTKIYGRIAANDQVSFEVREAETVALVGESGSGKSTVAHIIMGLTQATAGSATLKDQELARLPVNRRRPETLRALQMIFQNPFDTLNPSQRIGAQIARVIRKFGIEHDAAGIGARVRELLARVQLPPELASHFPKQLSGGQKQRLAIARAFAGQPELVVADEPVSALDVSVQAAVVALLLEIQRNSGTALLFISHDLALVRYLADRVVVMYRGCVVEQGTTEEVFAPPYHPYTEMLLAAIPIADPSVVKRSVPPGIESASVHGARVGCCFAARCAYRIKGTCEREEPPLREFASGHRIACHLPAEELARMSPIFEVTPS